MIKQSVARRLPVYMQESTGAPVLGLAWEDVVVKYKKEGDNALTGPLELDPGVDGQVWWEIGQGLYEILFKVAELNTIGFFNYFVTGGSALQYPGLADISANLLDDVNTNVDSRASEANATSNRDAILLNDNNNADDIKSNDDANTTTITDDTSSIKATVEAFKTDNFNMSAEKG